MNIAHCVVIVLLIALLTQYLLKREKTTGNVLIFWIQSEKNIKHVTAAENVRYLFPVKREYQEGNSELLTYFINKL